MLALRCALARSLICVSHPMTPTDDHAGSIPIQLVYEDDLDAWRNAQSDFVRNWASTNVFKGERNKLLVVPDAQGRPACVALGMGRRGAREEFSCWLAAGLPDRLPEGKYHLAETLQPAAAAQFAFGWAYGQYRFERYRRNAAPRSTQLRLPGRRRRRRDRATTRRHEPRSRSHQYARERHVAGGAGAFGDRCCTPLWRATPRDHRR